MNENHTPGSSSAVAEVRNITRFERLSDQSVGITFTSARACSAFATSINELAAQVEAAPQAEQAAKHLPGWERGIATVTLTGHQLREALEFINPDGAADRDQLDDELTFGIVPHRDDDGKEATGMCCWNDDTDGVLPLDGEPAAAPERAAAPADPRDAVVEAARRLIKAKGRYHTELNYKALAAALDQQASAPTATPTEQQ